MKNSVLRMIVPFIFGVFVSLNLNSQTKIDSTVHYTKQVDRAISQSKNFPYKSYRILKRSLEYYKKKADTTQAIKCLIHMSEIQFQKSKYSVSFDNTWEGLYLSRKTGNKRQTANFYLKLSKLYDVFSMDDEVFDNLRESLKISKDIYFEDNNMVKPLIASYMNLAVKERKSENYAVALKYLDSCLLNEKVIENKQVEMPFIDAERGYIMVKLGNYDEATKFLHLSDKYAQAKTVDYRTNLSLYLGELNAGLKRPDSAIFYFKRGLNLINTKNYRPDLKAEILHNLANVYFEKKKNLKAYNYLDQSRVAADSMLQLKNKTNGELFEVKDGYLRSLYEKNEQLAQQEQEIAENKLVQFWLKIIIALSVLLIIILTVFYRMRLKLKRTLHEKKETELEATIKEEQNNAKMEAKSKELTSYALQLIDKEKDIEELLQVLKEKLPSSYNSLSYKYKKGTKDLWDSFNLRFTEVNQDFYEKLKEKHSNLSNTQRKHCALIKLNFGTKEMARILNIEPHSVHISRSRIRRKMGLSRSENLEKYIADL